MTDKTTLTIPFADESGDGEARWIRLEQVALPDEGVTMEQAAELIDALYGINACEDGLGNGGEEADEEALPEEEEFLDTARERLGLDICEQGESATWECEVDVFRSHQDDGYSLQGERMEVGATTPMSKMVSETVMMDGASYDLAWPYGGDIVVSGGATVKEVRGSTVNFAAPVKGRVRIRYQAVWDRVAITVRKNSTAQSGVSLAGVLAVSGGAAKSTREDDSASVVAFWRDLAAECALKRPPEDEQEMSAAEIERLCNRETDWHVGGECWQTIERYNLCNCSGREAPDAPEPEDEDAPCPEGVRPGSFLGVARRLGEYVDCEGEDDEGLNTAEFFKEHCCEDNPYSPLPRCRETREPHKGGKEIEHGPERWKELYGESVRLTAVTPESGNCGELVKTWAVPEELERPPVLPERLMIERGLTFTVSVLSGGRAPFTWSPPGGVTLIGSAAYGFMGIFRADDEFDGGDLVVIDACGRAATCRLRRQWCLWTTGKTINPAYDVPIFEHEKLHAEFGYIWPSDYLLDTPYDYNAELFNEFVCSPDIWNGRYCQKTNSKYYQLLSKAMLFSASGKYAVTGCLGLVAKWGTLYWDPIEGCFLEDLLDIFDNIFGTFGCGEPVEIQGFIADIEAVKEAMECEWLDESLEFLGDDRRKIVFQPSGTFTRNCDDEW